jgi:glycosyltransferase involved in cell wall biosynthesis
LEKGVDNLLRAWQVVSRGFPEWQLKIVGPDSGGYLSKMKALKEKLRLKRIEFVGALYGEKKIEAYRNAELFVLPSPSENFGISVAEALSVGIPVIVTKGTPWRNLESLGAGWWIDIGVDPLVACLEVALSKPRDILKAMGIRGREWIRIEFSWTEVTRKMIETYQWILRGGSKPDWIFE